MLDFSETGTSKWREAMITIKEKSTCFSDKLILKSAKNNLCIRAKKKDDKL